MFKKAIGFIFLFSCLLYFSIKAQQAPMAIDTISTNVVVVDSLPLKTVDTISPRILILPDSATLAAQLDSLKKGFGYPIFSYKAFFKNYIAKSIGASQFQTGDLLPKGDRWILFTLLGLIVVFAVVKQTFAKQLTTIVQSFFSNRVLGNLNKEDTLFTSWPFFLLFAQFGFTIGLFCYLAAQFKQLTQVSAGFQYYITISIIIVVLYGFKIIVLRLLGFVFNIQKPIHEYISILYLSYFNASLLFIPLVFAFALSPLKFGNMYIAIAIIILLVIFVFQFIRAAINILSTYRFSKVYLFLYFCTLEICPILILIKTIGF